MIKYIIVFWAIISNCLADKLELEELDENLGVHWEKIIKNMPPRYLAEIKSVESSAGLIDLNIQTLKWMSANLYPKGDEALGLKKRLGRIDALKNQNDLELFLRESFWSKVKGRDFHIADRLEDFETYWKESTTPNISVVPGTNEKLEWIWKLPVATRQNGIIHVGLVTVSRKFICFEQNRGIYYPTGATLEKVRAEIVQDPDVSLEFIGKGYLKNKTEVPGN